MEKFERFFFSREPAMWYGLVNAAIALLLAFGIKLDEAQIGAILAVVNIILALATRQAVVPMVTHVKEVEEALETMPPQAEVDVVPTEAAI